MEIGKQIKKCCEKQKISRLEFAKMIDCTAQNVDNIYTRNSIDIDLLLKISIVLRFDFFNQFSEKIKNKLGELDYSLSNTQLQVEDPQTNYYKENIGKIVENTEEILTLLKKIDNPKTE